MLPDWLSGALSQHHHRLTRVEGELCVIRSLLEQIMIDVAKLVEAAQRETTVDDSILALVQTLADQLKALAQQLADAIAAADPVAQAAIQKQIDDAVASMTTNADKISAAVVANTPTPPTP